jgi:hypothetical protein
MPSDNWMYLCKILDKARVGSGKEKLFARFGVVSEIGISSLGNLLEGFHINTEYG